MTPAHLAIGFVAFIIVLFGIAFWLGIEHSRGEIRSAAAEMSAQPTNTFSKCLTEGWELTGELASDWKAGRKWVLR